MSPHDAHRILPSPNFDAAWNNARENNEVTDQITTPSINYVPFFPESNVAGPPSRTYPSFLSFAHDCAWDFRTVAKSFSWSSSSSWWWCKCRRSIRLHPPPNAGVDWQSPFVVRGDFDGVRIIGLTSLFHWNVDNNGEKVREEMVIVGNELGEEQVLSLLRCDPSSSMHSIVEPCCFIGYASGRVAAISATLNSSPLQNHACTTHTRERLRPNIRRLQLIS